MKKPTPEAERAKRRYLVLGVHDDVKTVEGKVTRVRMFIDGQPIDEDFPTPRTITIEEQLEAMILERITKLKGERADG